MKRQFSRGGLAAPRKKRRHKKIMYGLARRMVRSDRNVIACREVGHLGDRQCLASMNNLNFQFGSSQIEQCEINKKTKQGSMRRSRETIRKRETIPGF
jgi:hypothetical protein